MIEMRENRYDDIRKDEVGRSSDKHNSSEEKPDSYRASFPKNNDAPEQKEADKFDEYNPWS